MAIRATAVVRRFAIGRAQIAFFVADLNFAVTTARSLCRAVEEAMAIRTVVIAVVAGFA